MPRRNRRFTDADMLRFIGSNLSEIDREVVICSILLATGNTKQGTAREIAGLLKDLASGKRLEVFKAAFELVELIVGGEKRFNADF